MLLVVIFSVIGWFLCGWTGYLINLCTYEARAHQDKFWINGFAGVLGLIAAVANYTKRSLKRRHVMYGKPGYGQSYYLRTSR